MKKFKRIISLVAACTMVLSLAACGNGSSNTGNSTNTTNTTNEELKQSGENKEASGEVKYLIASHSLDTTHPVHQGFVEMDKLLQEYSDGTMAIKIYPSSSLGDEDAVLETQALGGGTIDFSAPSGNMLQPFSAEFLTIDFPFAFENYDEVWNFYDGEFGEYLYSTLDGTGLVGLAWWDNGFRNLTTTKKEVHVADDLKGVKIRTMSSKVHMASFNAIGAAATPMPVAELYSALQQGVVDGQENPVANIYGYRFYEVQNFITMTRHVHDPSPLVMSEDSWIVLTDEQKEWVKKAAVEAGNYMREISVNEELEKIETLKENGMTYIEITPEERQTFIDKTKDVYKNFEKDITPEGLELYFKCLEEAKG